MDLKFPLFKRLQRVLSLTLVVTVVLSFFLKNKAFVYRGQEYEKIGSFNQRIQSQFPDAQVWIVLKAQLNQRRNGFYKNDIKRVECVSVSLFLPSGISYLVKSVISFKRRLPCPGYQRLFLRGVRSRGPSADHDPIPRTRAREKPFGTQANTFS